MMESVTDRAIAYFSLARRQQLRKLPIARLKELWDLYDGTNAPHGYSGEDIHAELNRRGEGEYCAV
jgi:hypothetical protein